MMITRTKRERLTDLKRSLAEVHLGSLLATTPDLLGACKSAARVLGREIPRIEAMPDEGEELVRSLERVDGLVGLSLGQAVARHPREAALVGVGDTPMRITIACSPT